MGIDDVLHQYRATGHAEVGFARAQSTREAWYTVIGFLAILALLAFATLQLIDVADDPDPTFAWRKPLAMFGVAVTVAALVLNIVALTAILGRRNRGWPGLSLSQDGIALAGFFTRLKPAIAWSSIASVTLQERGAGPPVVTLAVNGKGSRYVPRHLDFPPDQLQYLVEQARLIATGNQQM